MAYQAFGRVGPRAVVLCHEAISHLDLLWTEPAYVEQCRRLVADVVVTAARRAPRVMRAVNRLDAARHRRRAGGSG